MAKYIDQAGAQHFADALMAATKTIGGQTIWGSGNIETGGNVQSVYVSDFTKVWEQAEFKNATPGSIIPIIGDGSTVGFPLVSTYGGVAAGPASFILSGLFIYLHSEGINSEGDNCLFVVFSDTSSPSSHDIGDAVCAYCFAKKSTTGGIDTANWIPQNNELVIDNIEQLKYYQTWLRSERFKTVIFGATELDLTDISTMSIKNAKIVGPTNTASGGCTIKNAANLIFIGCEFANFSSLSSTNGCNIFFANSSLNMRHCRGCFSGPSLGTNGGFTFQGSKIVFYHSDIAIHNQDNVYQAQYHPNVKVNSIELSSSKITGFAAASLSSGNTTVVIKQTDGASRLNVITSICTSCDFSRCLIKTDKSAVRVFNARFDACVMPATNYSAYIYNVINSYIKPGSNTYYPSFNSAETVGETGGAGWCSPYN